MAARHLLLCYLASGQAEAVLSEAAELSRRDGGRLSVLVPSIDTPATRSCCGIQGDIWRDMVADARRDELQEALDALERLGCTPAHAAVEFGPSIGEITQRVAERWRCDAVGVRPRRAFRATGMPRRQLDALRAAVTCEVIELEGIAGT